MDKIKILYRDYEIKYMSNTESSASGVFGKCDNTMAIIKIDNAFGPQKTVNIMFHEIIHALFYQFGLDEGKKLKEEDYAIRLANGLTTVFRDNPAFIEFLKENLNA